MLSTKFDNLHFVCQFDVRLLGDDGNVTSKFALKFSAVCGVPHCGTGNVLQATFLIFQVA
jgi:hypothetical protein